MTQRRLIEEAFPLKKVSEDSQHEQWVSQGKPNSLLYWPARRPLAACRAALIAALMPDPGDECGRAELSKKIESITRWGTENGPALDYFRQEIRKAYGGRAPRVLDMFAGGGAIPLEAMRLGCDVVANDYNPVAWFILKCTLEFPQRLAGKTRPLPILDLGLSIADSPRGAAEAASKIENRKSKMQLEMPLGDRHGDLADHVRYWGEWVLERARAELAPYYPAVDGQPTVAYLWARTVPCPDPACGAEVPLLKTLWLCKKENKRRALRIVVPSSRGSKTSQVSFEVWSPGPKDEVPPGTMAGAKSHCPVCGVNIPKGYMKECGHAGQMGARMTAVVVDTGQGKEYRLPTPEEEAAARRALGALPEAAAQIPYGLPTEPLPGPEILGMRIPLYGFKTWADLFTSRQLLTLVTFVKWARAASDDMRRLGYPEEWVEVVEGYLTLVIGKSADYNCTGATWQSNDEAVGHLFTGAKLPITWDFVEINSIGESVSSYLSHLNLQQRVLDRLCQWPRPGNTVPTIREGDATELILREPVDLILTDPPYYDAVPYADVSDFFYIWIRRVVGDRHPQLLHSPLTPKDHELVQHSSQAATRMGKADYEDGMSRAFIRARENLPNEGRMVVVFAHKEPDAWQTLVTAMIQAGFVATASWPIDTEKRNRTRAMGSAALASSIWMVCRKRPEDAGVGRYAAVRRVMQERITERLRYFWDVGISGPDFVWAAVGPALESYSTYDQVRRLDGSPFTVGEFLREVRRMVADFALGKILKGHSTEGLDEWTRYYLMHRNLFGLDAAPVGECILLSQGYGLDLNELRRPRGLLLKASRQEESNAGEKSSGSGVRLARWDERSRDDLGEPHAGGGLPMVDVLHRLLHLWAAGNLVALSSYAAEKGLRNNDLFWEVAQAVLEMAAPKSRERTLLEAIVAWGRGKEPSARAVQDSFLDESTARPS